MPTRWRRRSERHDGRRWRRITALRGAGRRVAVELDGRPWRTIPVDAVAEAGLAVGLELDRARARTLAASCAASGRRTVARASALAARALPLVARGSPRARGRRGGAIAGRSSTGPSGRGSSTTRASRTQRARRLAERGAGDLLVLDDLVAPRRGRARRARRRCRLELEPERARAARIVASRGAERADGPLPRVARLLRGDPRAARCGCREPSATMSGLRSGNSLQSRSSEPVETVTLVSTTDLSYQQARPACPPEDAPA